MGRKIFDGKDYDDVIRKLETAWALDCSDAEAATLADISKASLSEFLTAHPEISERKEQLKEKPVLNARNTLHKAILQGDAVLALKYLERKRKLEFSTLQEIKHEGTIKTDSLLGNLISQDAEASKMASELIAKISEGKSDNK